MTQDVAIAIRGVGKRFGKDTLAIDGVDAAIRYGCITGLVGPDGAGKTTLIRLMAGLMLPTQGDITVAGFDTRNDSEAIHDILGYMPQKFGLYEDLTVQENLELYASLRGLEGQDQTAEAFERIAFLYRASTFYVAPRRTAFRRHETEAGAGLRAVCRAEDCAPR